MKLRVFHNNEPTGEVHNIDQPITTIGRDETCDICIKGSKISRLHCELIQESDFLVLIDRHSTNGTFVNNSRIVHHMLEIGDIIQMGNFTLRVESKAQAEDEIRWRDEDSSQVSFSLPIEEVKRKIKVISDTDFRLKKAQPTKSDETRDRSSLDLEEAPRPHFDSSLDLSDEFDKSVSKEIEKEPLKGLSQIKSLYEVSQNLINVSTVEELHDLICDTVFDMFKKAEYLLLFARSEEDGGVVRYKSVRCVSRDKGHSNAPLEISQSLFHEAIEKRAGIIAKDAVRDDRFDKTSSVCRLNIRSVMCAPLMSKKCDMAVLYVDNRTESDVFDQDDLELFTALASQFAIALEKITIYNNLQRAYHETILALINTLEAKDSYILGHHQRVCQYALGIAREMNLPADRCSSLQTAAMLHDIGKIGVSQHILSKTSSLSNTEFVAMKNHVQVGEYILQPIAYLEEVLPIIRSHHERFDGKGYPDGLTGEQIPLEARILGLADALDAMTTQRTYNEPITKKEAIERVRACAGTQFDPEVVKAFESYIDKFELISNEKTFIRKTSKDNGEDDDSDTGKNQDSDPQKEKKPDTNDLNTDEKEQHASLHELDEI